MPCQGFIGRLPEMEPFQGMTAGTSTTQGVALGFHIVPFQGGGTRPLASPRRFLQDFVSTHKHFGCVTPALPSASLDNLVTA